MDNLPEPLPCAVCGAKTTHRVAISFAHVIVGIIPLCFHHGQAVAHGHWAIQIEPEWGGPWLKGEDYQH